MKYLFLAVIGAIVMFDVSKFFFYRHQKLPEINQSNQIFGKGEEIVYIAAGDSTAVGLGATNEIKTYTYLVAEKLASENTIIYKNIGISGAQTIDLINNQLPQIISSNPQIIVISIGANDVTNFKKSASIIENYQTIKDELLSKTDAEIYISNIPSLANARILPLWLRNLLERKIIQVNKQINTLGSDRFYIVDIYSSIPYTPKTYANDQFHPSDEGYKNWTKTYLKAISTSN